MRDLLTWSLPLGRLFGVNVRIHVFFVVLILGLIGRALYVAPATTLETTFVLILLFFSVLLHEFGHCFAARAVEGDAHEVLLWPLGGLAPLEVPQTPRAHFVAAAAGPAVNALLCVLATVLLASGNVIPGAPSLLPSFNPLDLPLAPTLYSWSDNSLIGSKEGHGDLHKFSAYWRDDGNNTGGWVSASPKPEGDNISLRPISPADVKKLDNGPWVLDKNSAVEVVHEQVPPVISFWQVQLARLFWVNWILLLINMLPAFPLDGGRLLQAFLWWRSDHRTGTMAAIVVGFGMMLFVILLGIVLYDPLVLFLAYFIFLACRRQWIVLETGGDEAVFGYDFSQGYTSLEKEGGAAPPKKQTNFVQRWLQARAARKAQREQERREAEERRMDELLEKVQKLGLQALTDEERRFMQRVSARYRNRP